MTSENPFQLIPFYDSVKKRLKIAKDHQLVFDLHPAPEKDLDSARWGLQHLIIKHLAPAIAFQ